MVPVTMSEVHKDSLEGLSARPVASTHTGRSTNERIRDPSVTAALDTQVWRPS